MRLSSRKPLNIRSEKDQLAQFRFDLRVLLFKLHDLDPIEDWPRIAAMNHATKEMIKLIESRIQLIELNAKRATCTNLVRWRPPYATAYVEEPACSIPSSLSRSDSAIDNKCSACSGCALSPNSA